MICRYVFIKPSTLISKPKAQTMLFYFTFAYDSTVLIYLLNRLTEIVFVYNPQIGSLFFT